MTIEPTDAGVSLGGVSLRGVSLSRRGLALVADLWLEVAAGETVAIMGPSGAGKTTLLRAVAGLVDDAEREITRPGDRVSMVFQDPRLLPWRTALQNVELVCPPGETHRARHWLGAVGLGDATDVYPAQLSGGMRQRVAIARALAYPAPLVVVDEPFASLDTTTATAIRNELVAHLADSNRTVLWVTHDADEAATVASRILRLDGPPTGSWELIDQPTTDPGGTP